MAAAGKVAPLEVRAVDADAIFNIFTACPNDPKTLLLDVRPHKEFKRGHINQAYNPRLASNGTFLADYSQAQYSLPWSQDCWWGKPVIVYGPPGLARDHPVLAFLAQQGRCASLALFKPGYEAFEAAFPFLCTASVKANSIKKYPSVILPRLLFLGDWGDAQQYERLAELNVKRIVTVHNHPERLKLPPGVRHLKIELPDVEGADLSAHFNAAYEFIADAERLKQPVLVHCGAGVSRSAAVVMMYLMRSRLWSAKAARDHCLAARSLVCPNDGFWRLLVALEEPLGILQRSDPDDTMGFAGADAPAVQLDKQAAGQPVAVRMVTAKEVQQQQEAAQRAAAAAKKAAEFAAAAAAAAAAPAREPERVPLKRGRSRSRSHSRSRERRKHRSRSRSRSRERRKHRSRSRSRSEERRRRSPGRDGGRHSSRWAAAAEQASPGPAAGAAGAAAPPQQQQQQQQQQQLLLQQQSQPQQQGGWLVKLEVSKPEGLVGHLLLGPMTPHQRVIFGRAPSCSVVLEHLSVSRQHAQLSVDAAGSVAVLDMGSNHGTKLGDAWIKAQQPRTLAVGGTLHFGASTRAYKLLDVSRA